MKLPRFDKNALFKLLIPLAFIPPLTGWLGDILKDWITKGIEQDDWTFGKADLWLIVIGSILLAVLLCLVYRASKQLVSPSIIAQHQDGEVEAHPVLITLLSLQSGLEASEGGWRVKGQALPDTLDATCDPERSISGLSWQQNLRAARHHVKNGALKKLILIGSLSEKAGSGTPESLQLARQFFTHYLKDKNVEILAPGLENPAVYSPDFEKLEATRHALKKAIEYSGASDKDIIIDVTGGQKTASIAAMMVTLDRKDLMFQYVGTGSQTGRIFGFNVITETSQG